MLQVGALCVSEELNYGQFFYIFERAELERNFDTKTGRAARASRNAKWISFTRSEFAPVPRKCTKNRHRIGR